MNTTYLQIIDSSKFAKFLILSGMYIYHLFWRWIYYNYITVPEIMVIIISVYMWLVSTLTINYIVFGVVNVDVTQVISTT
jgi:hypothetical protein